MSGHSKWSTIKRQKGAADIKRGQTFTKAANAITTSVRAGGSGDPNANPRLRMAIESARAVNMPRDNIDRAIERGLGKGKEALEEVIYEGFGPGQVAFIIEGVTDNRLRTNQEVKSIFERNGGSLAGQGAVSYMFKKKGEIRVKSKGGNKDEEMLELIDLGADDVEDYEEPFDSSSTSFGRTQDKSLTAGAQGKDIQKYLVYSESSELNTMGIKITQNGFEVESQDLVMKPTTLQPINDQILAQKVINFAGKLEEHEDIQKVYANFDIPEELITKIQRI